MKIINKVSIFFILYLLFTGSTFSQTYKGPIFDAHVHYNIEALNDFLPADILDLFELNGVKAFISNSRTNEGTFRLAKEISNSNKDIITIVPFIRLYRNRADYTNWFRDPTIYEMVTNNLEEGTTEGSFRGIGEFHLYESKNANGEIAKKLMELSVKEDLIIMAHVDDVSIELLMSHAPAATIIWAHTGISGVSIERVKELLKKYPTLFGELSYRPGLTVLNGLLSPDWKQLLNEQSNRFLIGSDTWVNSRWESYSNIIGDYRKWLGELSTDAATNIAWNNGANLFGLK